MHDDSTPEDDKIERLTEMLYDSHDEEGERVFGKERWAHANIGWYSEDYSICSKVYAIDTNQETETLTSSIDPETELITHEIGEYGVLSKRVK